MTARNPTLTEWSQETDFEAFLESAGTGFIFKHSTRCPVSSWAHDEVKEFLRSHPDAPVFLVLVVENRSTSNSVAERLGVRHASPQAILVRKGKAVWDASHNEVSTENLGAAWSS